jgi:2-dehydropantoate 2-reductase
VISDNISKYIVFVGNNANAREFQDFINKNSNEQKQIAFGFQTNGGRYVNSRIVNIRLGGSMDIGSLDGKLSWHQLLENAFKNTKYKLIFNENMDSWLKTHMIFVMALAYVTYACNGNLRKINKNLTDQMVKALDEGYTVLETLGYKIIPAKIANLFKGGRNKFLMYIFLKIYALTPIPKLSDPTKESFPDETNALTKGFKDLKKKANIPTPNWDALESHIISKKNINK